MKGDFRYKHIIDDSKLIGIGSLFRGINNKRWSINLYIAGKTKNHINFGAAPILARHRTLNPTKSYPRSGKQHNFTITDAQTWKVGKIKDCPALANTPKNQDFEQKCFIAEEGGMEIYIPQFELARVLFYHDPYMARLSLQHNALSEEFYVDNSTGKTEINVLSEAEYPLFYYNRDDNRRFLSWVILDHHARQSFESIGTHLLTGRREVNRYQMWDFEFTPPPLTGAQLDVSGWLDFATNSFFVWEIWGLTKIPSSIKGEVDFINPNYERTVGGKPTKGNGSCGESPEHYELDDNELSDVDKATTHLMSEAVTVSFDKAHITNRISSKTRSVNHSIGEGEQDVIDKNLSANEKEITGSLPGGSWNNLNDQTDDAHLYMKKFDSFLEMVKVLESAHGCRIIEIKNHKLPKVGDSKKQWLADTQNPRCLAVVELVYENRIITLLEIDTSDGAANLSTMILRTPTREWMLDNIETIKVGIIKKSLGWPTSLFQEALSAKGFFGVPHPKSKHQGKLDPNEINPWAQRFVNWLSR